MAPKVLNIFLYSDSVVGIFGCVSASSSPFLLPKKSLSIW